MKHGATLQVRALRCEAQRDGRLEVRLDVTQLDCAAGELMALTGPSGSGKTTLLRTVAGLVQPSSGTIQYGDTCWFSRPAGQGRAQKQVQQLAPQARRIGMVFQDYALFPHLSALENVALAIPQTSDAERHAQARDWLAQMHLADLGHRLPHQLSGGQQQRVAVARALARQPQLLLLDEPFSAVDQVTRQSLQKELARLRRELHIPVILVTHDLYEARSLADQLVIMQNGRTLQNGRPEHVMRHPRNPAVAHLVGIPNVFSGRFVRFPAAPLSGTNASYAAVAWQGHTLYVKDKGKMPDGQAVNWVIAGECIRLAAPSQGQHLAQQEPNWLAGQIVETTRLGEILLAEIAFTGGAEQLSLRLSTREWGTLGLQRGGALYVCLAPEGMHLMPIRQERLGES